MFLVILNRLDPSTPILGSEFWGLCDLGFSSCRVYGVLGFRLELVELTIK